jgi:hypothetical protein
VILDYLAFLLVEKPGACGKIIGEYRRQLRHRADTPLERATHDDGPVLEEMLFQLVPTGN